MDIKVSAMSQSSLIQELESVSKILDLLFKSQNDVNKKIIASREIQSKLKCELDGRRIKKFYKDPKKFTEEQWLFILEDGYYTSQIQSEYSKRIIEKLGFSTFGFYEETGQRLLSINRYSRGTLPKTPYNFNLFKNYLKPVKITGGPFGETEFGIRMAIHNIEDDVTSVIYIKNNGKIILYRTRYSSKKTFESFEHFIKWLIVQYDANRLG